MQSSSSLKVFLSKWGKFLSIMFSPGALIPLVLSGAGLYFAFIIKNFALSVVLSVGASLSATVAGVFIKDDWDKLQGSSLLEKKGRSAIRNLDSIGQQIIQVRSWISDFCKNKRVSSDNLQEIDRHLSTTQLNISSGLEDWIDIVPELRERKEIIDYYQGALRTIVEQVLKSKKELATSTDEKRGQLEQRIKELEKSLRELKARGPEVLVGGISALSPATGKYPYMGASFYLATCEDCHRQYVENVNPAMLSLHPRLCDECKNKK